MGDRWRAERFKSRLSALALIGAAVASVTAPDGLLAWSPPCLWHSLGFAHCWGCGITRAAIALMQGDVQRAIRLNPSICAVAPLVLCVYATQLSQALRASFPTEMPERIAPLP
jgi:Protein of unknown function (DUF2752)